MQGLNTTYEWIALILLVLITLGVFLRGPWR